MVRENRLFLGNPGTGKSTLINCLIGKNLSRAGINWGGGLTRGYHRYEHDDIAYMDTPGLADSSIPKEAADAITEALRQGGTYKLFFIMRLQNGRVVSEDVVTLERVLSAIGVKADKIRFSVVFNTVEKAQYALLSKPGSPEFKLIKSVVNSRRFKTDTFCLIPVITALNEASDALETLPEHVYKFVNSEAVSMRIRSSSVQSVDPRDFEQQAREIQEEMERVLRENAVMQSELASGEYHRGAIQRDWDLHAARYSSEKNSPTHDYVAHVRSSSAQTRDDKPSSSILIPKKTLFVVSLVIVVVFATSISLVATLTLSKSDSEVTSSPDLPVRQPHLVSCVGQDELGATINGNTTNITYVAQIAASPLLFFAIKGNNTEQFVFLATQPEPVENDCPNHHTPNASLWYVYSVTQNATEANSTTPTLAT